MEKSITSKLAFIWDLDGTLLDSYDVIVGALYQTYFEIGIKIDKAKILATVIAGSVTVFTDKMEERFGVPFSNLLSRYVQISAEREPGIKLMPHAKEALESLKKKGATHFVYTHRGDSSELILKNNGVYGLFDEVVTREYGLPRKPRPEGIDYLVKKHSLDRSQTYYVGDRSLDIECANAAHIQSIMYIPVQSVAKPTGKETYLVKDLSDIEKALGL